MHHYFTCINLNYKHIYEKGELINIYHKVCEAQGTLCSQAKISYNRGQK